MCRSPSPARRPSPRVRPPNAAVGSTVAVSTAHRAIPLHQRGGQFVLPVKENRQALFDAFDVLAWRDVPVAHRSIDTIRLAGRTDITEATRWAARSMDRPFTILGLTL